MPIQTNLPEDFPSPNSINDKYTPVTRRAGTPYTDPTGALPPGTEQYTVSSNQWLAIPFAAGKYEVRARGEGQVVYISQTPNANASLRVTKTFNIETQNRTVMYIKGQSILDQIIKNLEQQIASLASKDEVYTKTEVDLLLETELQRVLNSITNVMQFRGTVPTQADLPTQGVVNGDVYQALDTGTFYVAHIDDRTLAITWEQLSGTFVDLMDYYNKAATDLLLEGKASVTDLNQYKALVENFIPTFTWQQNEDPSVDNRPQPVEVANKAALEALTLQDLNLGAIYKTLDDNKYYEVALATYTTVPTLPTPAEPLGRIVKQANQYYQVQENNGNNEWVQIAQLPKAWSEIEYDANWVDPTREWDTWLQPNTGLIFVRKVSQLDGNLFWLNSIESALLVSNRNYVTTNTAQSITAVKTFTQLPETDTNLVPTKDTQFVTKKYVDENGGGGGTTTIPANVARLDSVQTFTAQNNFQVSPIIDLPAVDINNVTGSTLVTKEQTETLIGNSFNTNPTIANPIDWDTLADNQLVTKGILQGAGGNAIDTTNLAKLDSPNTFADSNTFMNSVVLNTDPVSGNDAVRLSYMNTKITDEITRNNQQYYDITTIDTKLQDYVRQDGASNFMRFMGTLNNFVELQNVQNPEAGNTYYVKDPVDKRGFWSYNGTTWESTGSGTSINDANYAKLSNGNFNTYNSSNTFNLEYQDPNDPNATPVPLTFSVGDWLSVTKNGISLNNAFLFNSTRALFKTTNFSVENIANFEANAITFNTNPTITTVNTAPTDNDLITKSYVDTALGNVNVDTTNLAKLNEANVFTADNTTTVTTFTDASLVTKKYVDDAIANNPGGGGTGTVDTTNLAKLNEANVFTADNTTTVTTFTDTSLVTKQYVDHTIEDLLLGNNLAKIQIDFFRTGATNYNALGANTFNLIKYDSGTNTETTIKASKVTPNGNLMGGQLEFNIDGTVYNASYTWDLGQYSSTYAFSNIFTHSVYGYLSSGCNLNQAYPLEITFDTPLPIEIKGCSVGNTGNPGGSSGWSGKIIIKLYTAKNRLIGEKEFTGLAKSSNVKYLGNIQSLGGGGNFDVSKNYIWTGDNTFNGKLQSGTTAATLNDLTDTEVPTKKLVAEAMASIADSLRTVSTLDPDIDKPLGHIWIKTSYAQDANDPTIFTDKPKVFISVGTNKWWSVHDEGLLE